MAGERPTVGIIMGSQSDWDTLRHAADQPVVSTFSLKPRQPVAKHAGAKK